MESQSRKSLNDSLPVVRVKAQGRLLRVKCMGDVDDEWRPAKRGKVTEFTPSSRMRLLQVLARLSPPESRGYRFKVSFLTLTTREVYTIKEFKEFMVIFFKRAKRKYPTMSIVWRAEYQKRGAAHCHLILYNAPWIDKKKIQAVWGDIVGEDEPFTRIEKIRSYKHLIRYASKYVAKVGGAGGFNSGAKTTAAKNGIAKTTEPDGRVWGVYNRACLPFADEIEVVIPQDGAWYLIRRYCMKFYEWLDPESGFGFTVFTDDPYHALNHIVSLSKSWGAVQ